MNAIRVQVAILIAIAIMASGATLAYAQQQPKKVKVKIEMREGDEATLFYGGGGNIKEVFPEGCVLKVYARNRAFGLNENVRIGKVKIVGYEGDNFIKVQVVEGTIGPGDVVKLKVGTGNCAMVVPPVR